MTFFLYVLVSISLKYFHVQNSNFSDATERERRTQVGKKFAESWESLNSATSSTGPSSNERLRHQHLPKTAQGRHSITSRSTIFVFFFLVFED